MVEHGVDRGAACPVDLHGRAQGFRCSPPNAYVRVRAKRLVRNLEHDAEYVLLEEEIAACELQVVEESKQIEKERVAAEPGEELVRPPDRDDRIRPKRYRGS